MKDVNYIISFYNGKRRHYGRETHWKTFLDTHIDFIKNNMIEQFNMFYKIKSIKWFIKNNMMEQFNMSYKSLTL